MGQTENQQPEHSPVVHGGGSPAARLGPLRKQADARPEQNRKQRHEFPVGQNMAGQPNRQVDTGEIAPRGGIQVRGARHGERLHVHDQNAEHGKPPEHIKALNALAGSDWGVDGHDEGYICGYVVRTCTASPG